MNANEACVVKPRIPCDWVRISQKSTDFIFVFNFHFSFFFIFYFSLSSREKKNGICDL